MITGDMSITTIVEKYPKTVEVFMGYGMHCFGCMAARFENLAQGAMAHGVEVESLLKDLNRVVEN
jgi:hybrid cluster-associated redox disulfide protein